MRTVRALLPTIVAVLMLAFATAPAQAQTRPAPPPPPPDTTDYSVGVGALGGLTWSTIKGDAATNESVKARNGFMAGIWFGGNYSGRVGFMGEVSYVMKGANEQGGPGELKLYYLEVPALVRINFGARSRRGTTFYVVAGPVLDVKIKASLDGVDATDDYKGFDFGLLAGAGAEARRIGVEVRGNWGLLTIFDPGEGGEKIRNFTLQIVGKYI